MYGIGMQIETHAPHTCQKVTRLQDMQCRDIGASVNIGDTLTHVDGHSVDTAGTKKCLNVYIQTLERVRVRLLLKCSGDVAC